MAQIHSSSQRCSKANQVKSDFTCDYTQIWDDEAAATLADRCEIQEMEFEIMWKIIVCLFQVGLSGKDKDTR